MIELIRGGRKVEWIDIGEGWSGDYDPDDPDDIALLRFDVLELQQVHEPTHADDDVYVMDWSVGSYFLYESSVQNHKDISCHFFLLR